MGIGKGCQPSRFAAAARISASVLYWKAGMGRGFLRGGANGFSLSSPETPTSHSAFW